jgi:hypothetical protein
MYSTTSDNCRERFTRNGWNITADDDAPRPPDGDPLASGQRKRYSHRSSPAPGTMKTTDFDLIKFIESQQRGGLIGNAKTENQIAQLIRERCPVSQARPGACLPDKRLLRDLQLTTGGLSGANLAGAVHNPLQEIAGAARPSDGARARWCGGDSDR